MALSTPAPRTGKAPGRPPSEIRSNTTGPTAKYSDVTWSALGTPGNALGNTRGEILGNTPGNALGNTLGNALQSALGNTLGHILGNTRGNTPVAASARASGTLNGAFQS